MAENEVQGDSEFALIQSWVAAAPSHQGQKISYQQRFSSHKSSPLIQAALQSCPLSLEPSSLLFHLVSLGKSCTHPRRHLKCDSRICLAWRAETPPGTHRSHTRCTPYHHQRQYSLVIPRGRKVTPLPNPRNTSRPLWEAPIQAGVTLDS